MMRSPSLPLVVVLVGAAAFILLSGQSLPPLVASHFGPGGNANGFMPRNAYLGLMVFIAVGIPFVLALAHSSVRFLPVHFVSLPNSDYWLTPERRDEAFAYLRNHSSYLSVLLASFLSFIHWLVVRANELQPPRLSTSLFVTGLVFFLLAVALWIAVLVAHFRRRS